MNQTETVLRPLVAAAILVAGMAVVAAFSTPAAGARYAKKMRILFIGNSFTHANDLPGMLIAMMATKGIGLETKQVTPGGCTLKKHWEDGNAIQVINEGNWDYVIIQEQSQMPVFQPPVTLKYAALLAGAAAKTGAKPVFYLTWAYRDKPEMQAGLTKTYMRAGKDANCLVAPAGVAWEGVRKKYPRIPLHAKDGKHPSVQGSYLTACVMYATILRRDPMGLPGRLRIDKQVRPNVIMRRQPCSLTTVQVRPLQQVAWKVVEELRSYKPVREAAAEETKDAKEGEEKGETNKAKGQ